MLSPRELTREVPKLYSANPGLLSQNLERLDTIQ